jgi:predicted phosphodiesterase
MWNKFLEEQIKRNDKLIVLTHHPLYTPKKFEPKSRFLKKMNGEIQFWFSNKSKKVSKEKSIIFIHGHTHDISYEKNHLTNAIGRKENCFEMKLKSFDIDEKK